MILPRVGQPSLDDGSPTGITAHRRIDRERAWFSRRAFPPKRILQAVRVRIHRVVEGRSLIESARARLASGAYGRVDQEPSAQPASVIVPAMPAVTRWVRLRSAINGDPTPQVTDDVPGLRSGIEGHGRPFSSGRSGRAHQSRTPGECYTVPIPRESPDGSGEGDGA